MSKPEYDALVEEVATIIQENDEPRFPSIAAATILALIHERLSKPSDDTVNALAKNYKDPIDRKAAAGMTQDQIRKYFARRDIAIMLNASALTPGSD